MKRKNLSPLTKGQLQSSTPRTQLTGCKLEAAHEGTSPRPGHSKMHTCRSEGPTE